MYPQGILNVTFHHVKKIVKKMHYRVILSYACADVPNFQHSSVKASIQPSIDV